MIKYFLWLAFFLLTITSIAHSLKCFQCSTEDDPTCKNSDVLRTTPQECKNETDLDPSFTIFCIKVTEKKILSLTGKVYRDCRIVNKSEITLGCSQGSYSVGDQTWEQCYCSEDGCNISSRGTSSFTWIIISFLLILYIHPILI